MSLGVTSVFLESERFFALSPNSGAFLELLVSVSTSVVTGRHSASSVLNEYCTLNNCGKYPWALFPLKRVSQARIGHNNNTYYEI